MTAQRRYGRAKASLIEQAALSKLYEPIQQDPTADSEIQHHLDRLDETAREMEMVWGTGRLVQLADEVLRQKFFKQMARLNEAIENNSPSEVATHAEAMARGWRALDAAARGVGHKPKPHAGTEIRLSDGRIVAIVPDGETVPQYRRNGTTVITLTEAEMSLILSDLLTKDSVLGQVLKSLPGARLTALQRKPQPDWSRGDDLPF